MEEALGRNDVQVRKHTGLVCGLSCTKICICSLKSWSLAVFEHVDARSKVLTGIKQITLKHTERKKIKRKMSSRLLYKHLPSVTMLFKCLDHAALHLLMKPFCWTHVDRPCPWECWVYRYCNRWLLSEWAGVSQRTESRPSLQHFGSDLWKAQTLGRGNILMVNNLTATLDLREFCSALHVDLLNWCADSRGVASWDLFWGQGSCFYLTSLLSRQWVSLTLLRGD